MQQVVRFSEELSYAPRNLEQGSNNWVLSGLRTTTGKPLLANDPHLRLQNPALWYIADLFSPHFDDLLWLWRDRQYIPLSTRPADWGRTWTLELRP